MFLPQAAISALPAFADNYIWLLQRADRAVVVDPGDARVVQLALRERRLALSAILVTHHHMDHVGGVAALAREHGVPVYGPQAEAPSIPALTDPLGDGDLVALPDLDLRLRVWSVPGHTRGHIAYVSEPATDDGFVLCGDTLFSAGCGRLFEGTAEQLHDSLTRLRALPEGMRVYCTHEYTLANLAFAAAVEPGAAGIRDEIERIRDLRSRGRPSLPSTIGRERRINPFLRCEAPAVAAAAANRAGRPLAGAAEVFRELRLWKDTFRPSGV